MIKFTVSEDKQWLSLIDYDEDYERRQIDISLTKKIHNFYFHPLVKKKVWDGAICFVDKKLPVWRVPIGLWSEIYQIGQKYKIDVSIEGLEEIIDSSLHLMNLKNGAKNFLSIKKKSLGITK